MNSDVPYFCQWESRFLVSDFIEGRRSAIDDPQWQNSGALSREDYALWANQICGMACLKMALAFKTGVIHKTFSLLKLALDYGAYVIEEDFIRGMIYAPFVQMLDKEFGIEAEVVTQIVAADIKRIRESDHLFIASVHPVIRWSDREPPKKGGHLVLVTEVNNDQLTFHNPSGYDEKSQENVCLDVINFERFFAGRGVLIK